MVGRQPTYNPSILFFSANETIEKVASFGLLANMVMYLTKEYHIGNASAGSILFIWSAISNFLPIVGAFISDSYLGRFRVIAWGSIASLLVSIPTAFLSLTEMSESSFQPPP